MNIVELAIKRPVFVVMFILSIITLGVIGYLGLGVDLLPNVEYPTITVVTVYPGASSEEIESLISKPIEDALSTLEGLDKVYSSSLEGVSYVTAQFGLGVDMKIAEIRLRENVNGVKRKLPEDAEEPIISRFTLSRIPVIVFAIRGEKNLADLRELIEDKLRPEIEKMDGVAKIEIFGGRTKAVYITINKSVLNARAILLNSIIEAIKKENINYPVGVVRGSNKKITLRVAGKFDSLKEIENIPVLTLTNEIIKLKDIAKISFSLKEESTKTRANKKNAVLFAVYKQSGKNTVAISNNVKKKIKTFSKLLPEDVTIEVMRDPTVHIEESLRGLQEDILIGAFFAVLVVWLFLGNLRSTIITGLALPNSLIGAFFLVSLFGFSLNLMVLMGLSLAIGLLIDDSIVVRENIFRYIEKGMPPKEAAVKGANEVALAVIATTASIMAVFIPIAFLQGIVGQFFKQFGLTIAFALFISLLDAFTTAPMLSAYWWKKEDYTHTGFGKTLKKISQRWNMFYEKLNSIYRNILLWALDRKKTVMLLTIGLLIFSLAIFPFVGLNFMPDDEYNFFELNIETYPGAPLSKLDSYMSKIEDYLMSRQDIKNYYATVGAGEENKGTIFVNLVEDKNIRKGKKRQEISQEIIKYVRENFSADLDISEEPTGSTEVITGGGDSAPLVIRLSGPDIKILEKLSQQIKEILLSMPGLLDVNTTYKPGNPELVMRIDRVKAGQLGVSTYDIGAILNALYGGREISKYSIGDKEYEIILQIDEKDRQDIRKIHDIMLTNKEGQKIPLDALVRFQYSAGPVEIKREGKQRVIKITANLKTGYALGDVINRINEKIKKQIIFPAGYEYSFSGQATSMKDTIQQMSKAMALSLLFMYMILASLYNSFIQPLILMTAIPLAIIGAFILLLITGQQLDIMAMIGLLMVMGLVAKNGILLIDFTNQKRREGFSPRDALLYAGPIRLRPILMTTFAMIAGMLPLAFGVGKSTIRTESMPIAVIGGLLTSTFLTLVVVPVIYEWVEKRKSKK